MKGRARRASNHKDGGVPALQSCSVASFASSLSERRKEGRTTRLLLRVRALALARALTLVQDASSCMSTHSAFVLARKRSSHVVFHTQCVFHEQAIQDRLQSVRTHYSSFSSRFSVPRGILPAVDVSVARIRAFPVVWCALRKLECAPNAEQWQLNLTVPDYMRLRRLTALRCRKYAMLIL